MAFKCQLSLTGLTKVASEDNKISFNIVPLHISNTQFPTFSVQKNQKNFAVRRAQCDHGCQIAVREDVLVVNLECAKKHMINFQVNHIVEAVVKAPPKMFFNDKKIFKFEVSIPGFDDIKFESSMELLEDGTYGLWIMNRDGYNVKVGGHSFHHYFCRLYECDNFATVISFEFNPDTVRKQMTSEKKVSHHSPPIMAFAKCRIQEEVLSLPQTSTLNTGVLRVGSYRSGESFNPKVVELNERYADVLFNTANGFQVSGYRCILSKLSPIFDEMFKKRPIIPIEINVPEFSSKCIKHGLDFCHGKINKISAYQLDLFKFSTKYSLETLKDQCLASIKDQITSENVHELLNTANHHGMMELQGMCIDYINGHYRSNYAMDLLPGFNDDDDATSISLI